MTSIHDQNPGTYNDDFDVEKHIPQSTVPRTSPTFHNDNNKDTQDGVRSSGANNSLQRNQSSQPSILSRLGSYITRFEAQLVAYNLEARGIARVEVGERIELSWMAYLQVFVLWVSINLAANNIILGMLGPAVYGLSFLDASLCAVFGTLVGSLPTAWTAIWGPISGNRTLAFSRYAMGWWPNKLVVLLNIIVLLGYSLIDCVVGGQILAAVSPNGSMSVAVGIVIVAVITWVVTTFGIQIFHHYERYAFIPQLIVYCILAGVSANQYDLSTPSQGDTRTIAGNRLSFFSICLSAAITYAGVSADFFVYYPPTTSAPLIFLLTTAGLAISFTFSLILGVGLASAIPTNTAYAAAYNDHGAGALLVAGYSSLGGFGRFCSVIAALGLIANTIPPTYSSGVDFQILGSWPMRVPRFIWNTFGVIIYTVCALAGRSSLSDIFTSFLGLMGYWVVIWFAILLEEWAFWRRGRWGNSSEGYNWKEWNERDKLPPGYAAMLAFLVGWAGAIICMAQTWYIGPVAAFVGEYGADMGNYVAFSWAALVYPPLRYWERRHFGR